MYKFHEALFKDLSCTMRSLSAVYASGLNFSVNTMWLKSELVSHLNIDNSEIFSTQTWTPKQRCDQVPAGSKHPLPNTCIIHLSFLCIRGISQCK